MKLSDTPRSTRLCEISAPGSQASTLDLTVVMVNYNGARFVADCLRRTLPCLEDSKLRYETIVIENGSDDGSREVLQDFSGRILVVPLVDRVGFSAANNIAVQQAAPSHYILFLNSDAWIQPGTVESLVGFLNDNDDYAAVAPIELTPDDKVRRTWWPYPTPLQVSMSLLVNALMGPRYRNGSIIETDSNRWNSISKKKVIKVGYLPGFCLLVRRSVFLWAGQWDEQYPLYSEDVDLGYRISRSAFKQGIITNAFAYHIGGASTSLITAPERVKKLWAARLLFFYKHFRDSARLLRVLAVVADRIIPQSRHGLKNAMHYLKQVPESPNRVDYRERQSFISHRPNVATNVSVIIPSWNRFEALKRTLSSYRMANLVGEVIVALDGLAQVPPELAAIEAEAGATCVFIPVGRRMGQTACRLLGVQAAKHEWILFGEDDVTIESDYVARLFYAIEREKADIAAGRIITIHRGQTVEQAQAAADWRVGYPIDVDLLQADFSRLCPGLHKVPFLHSVALMPKTSITKVGFDVNYRGNQYREETDFYLKAHANGYELVWDNDALCYHHHGSPFDVGGHQLGRGRYIMWTILNNHRFALKNRAILRDLGIKNPRLFSIKFALVWVRNFLRTQLSRVVPTVVRRGGIC